MDKLRQARPRRDNAWKGRAWTNGNGGRHCWPSWKKPVGHNHRKQAAGTKTALMPDILTTSFAAEALKRTWVDLMLCVAIRKKNGGVAANLQSTTILRVSCLWGGMTMKLATKVWQPKPQLQRKRIQTKAKGKPASNKARLKTMAACSRTWLLLEFASSKGKNKHVWKNEEKQVSVEGNCSG